jgi:2-C-methyl-D-erythritol 4-phosphate cytidylyltransferase
VSPLDEAVAVVLAGGRGSRVGDEAPKQFLDLNGMTVLQWTLSSVSRCAEIVVVYHRDYEELTRQIVQRAGLAQPVTFVEGGSTRRLSVRAGLDAVSAQADDLPVVLQNAASPNSSPALIAQCLDALEDSEMAVAFVPAVHTIFRHEGGRLLEVLDRASLGYTADPTVYRLGCFRRIVEAQATTGGAGEMTLDTARALGIEIRLVPSPRSNVKLTTHNDLIVLRELMSSADLGGAPLTVSG